MDLSFSLRNYFYNDMDPLHPMKFWNLVAQLRLDMDITLKINVMDLLSDSSYHLQFEQTAFNRQANTA